MTTRRFLLALLVLAAPSVATSQDLTCRAIVGYQSYLRDQLATNGLRQTYDLRLERALTDPARLRVFVRAEDYRGAMGSKDVGVTSSRFRGFQIQPGGEFLYNIRTLQAQVSFDMLRSRSRTGGLESARALERAAGRVSWHPEDLPALSIDATRYRSYDRTTRLNTMDVRAQAGLDYQWRQLRASFVQGMSRYDDGRADLARKTTDRRAQLGYDQSFWNGKITTVADLMGTVSRYDERTRAGAAVVVPHPVTIRGASTSIDETPIDGGDRPPSPNGALIDRGFSASAGVPLGPDAPTYQNLVFDFGRFAPVDELRISTRSAAGEPVRTGGGVQWDVYRSEDGVLWTRVTASVAFDLPQSLYSVTFPQQTVRWLKVVSFGTEVEPAFVTEVEAFEHRQLGAGEAETTDARLYGGSVSIGARPTRWLTLSYNGLFNLSDQSRSGRPSASTRDTDHLGSIQVNPFRSVFVGARFDRREVTQRDLPSQMLSSWTADLRWTPRAQLSLGLESTQQDENDALGTVITAVQALHVFARLLPSLELRGSIGRRTQNHIDDSLFLDGRFVNLSVVAQLTRTLRMTLDSVTQRADDPGAVAGVDGLFAPRDDRHSLELFWRAGAPLMLGLRVGRVETDRLSVTTQRYRLEWFPFAQGTVSIGGTFDEDFDPYTSRRSRRILFSPRWSMNRHAALDLNYTLVETTGPAASRNRTLFATLTLTR